MLFTAFSGASGVTRLALGGLLYPMREREHYPEKFALGLVTSAGSMGLLLPPSLAVLLYGVVAQVSIGDLFVAGLLPTLVVFGVVGGLGPFGWGAVYEAATLVGSLFIILGLSLGLTNLLIDAQVPMHLLEWIQSQVTSPLEFLMWMNLALLAVGCMMDIFSAIVIVTPLLLPLAMHFGIHPVHLGIVILANLEIGYLTPPGGINLFLASQRFRQPVFAVFRAALPFLALMLVWLALVSLITR